MSRPLRMSAVLAGILAALLLASCSKPDNGYQGWIEANLIFVAPDEVGRVQTLSVREGDTVMMGDLLFTVDDDLQKADFDQIKASLTNAQQTYDRASMLLKSGSGTQKDYDAATAVLLELQARSGEDTVHPYLLDSLHDRAEVHQASGMISVQLGVRPADALTVLRARAYASDRSMIDLARAVITHQLRFDD